MRHRNASASVGFSAGGRRGTVSARQGSLALAIVALVLAAMLPTTALANVGTVVTFSDANLEAAVRLAIPKPTGDVLSTEMETLTSLDFSGLAIAKLDGLEYAKNVFSLSLNNNQITDITPLSGMTSLTYLSLIDNQISDLSPLQWLTELNQLHLGTNNIGGITALQGLKKLTVLRLYHNEVVNIGPLTELTSLTSLDLEDNKVVDLAPLHGLTALTELNLGTNEIVDVDPLEGLDDLVYLYLHSNDITSVSSLSGLTRLRLLFLFQNQITDVTPLVNLKELTSLQLGQNPGLTNIGPLSGMTKLETLNIGYLPLTDLSPLSGMTKLTSLTLYGDQSLTDISPLATLPQLRWLNIAGNKIWDISALDALNAPTAGIGRVVICNSNWLDLEPGSRASATIAGLVARGYAVTSDSQKPGGAIQGSVTGLRGETLVGAKMKLAVGPDALAGAGGAYRLGFAPTGAQTLTFSKPFYYDYVTTLAVTAATTHTVNATLAPVRLTLKVARSPKSSSATYKRKKGLAKFTLSATLSDARGLATGASVWLQKSSNGKTWKTAYKLKTGSGGKVSRAFKARASSTTYYRWYAPKTDYNAAYTGSKQKVRVK